MTTSIFPWVLAVVLVLSASPLRAQPAQVILIRHAEKSDDANDTHLSTFGRARAAALVPYFLEVADVLKFGTPVAIYAPRAPNPKKHSVRGMETVKPLADALKLEVQTPFERDDYRKLVRDVLDNPKHQGKTVLVCWEHDVLAKMAPAFLEAVSDVKGAPKQWKWLGSRFDRVWVITFTGKSSATFHNYPQRLMYGDSKD
jgi:hypothetical protein